MSNCIQVQNCCCDIAFAGPSTYTTECYPTAKFNVGINADIKKLAGCKVLMCGPNNACGIGVGLDNANWLKVKNWMLAGGRLYVAGEYETCLGDPNRLEINNFMGFLGSGMTLCGCHTCNCNCLGYSPPAPWLGIPNGAVKIMQGLPGIRHACVDEVLGGTWLCKTNTQTGDDPGCTSSFPFMSIEKLGKGFVILTGDSNITAAGDGCLVTCEFFQRWLRNKSDNII